MIPNLGSGGRELTKPGRGLTLWYWETYWLHPTVKYLMGGILFNSLVAHSWRGRVVKISVFLFLIRLEVRAVATEQRNPTLSLPVYFTRALGHDDSFQAERRLSCKKSKKVALSIMYVYSHSCESLI